jgi:GTP cyclohydrolase FolE2
LYLMARSHNLRTADLQASAPEIQLGLTRAGVTGVQKAIRIRHEGREKTFAAEIACTVDLDPGQKGVHMSRFPELFGEAIDAVVIGEAFLVETLAEHIARHIVERQRAVRAEVRIEAQYPLARRTPVTGLPTQEIATLIGIAAASPQGVRRVVGASTRARARRASSAARQPSGCSRRGSSRATWTGSSSSCHSRRTTSAGRGRCSSAPTRTSTPSIWSRSSSSR